MVCQRELLILPGTAKAPFPLYLNLTGKLAQVKFARKLGPTLQSDLEEGNLLVQERGKWGEEGKLGWVINLFQLSSTPPRRLYSIKFNQHF